MITRENAVLAFPSAVDLTGKEGYAVKLNSSGQLELCSSASDIPFAIVTIGMPIGAQNSVAVCAGGYAGTVSIKLSATPGTVNAGTLLALNANATSSAGTTGVLYAQAVEAGQADELIEAVIFKPQTVTE